MSQDYQPGKFEDRSILPKEKFSESLIRSMCFSVAGFMEWRGVASGLETCTGRGFSFSIHFAILQS